MKNQVKQSLQNCIHNTFQMKENIHIHTYDLIVSSKFYTDITSLCLPILKKEQLIKCFKTVDVVIRISKVRWRP